LAKTVLPGRRAERHGAILRQDYSRQQRRSLGGLVPIGGAGGNLLAHVQAGQRLGKGKFERDSSVNSAFSKVCGTDQVAWLDGEHPKAHEGIVDRTICFQYTDGPCQYQVRSQVRTCQSDSGGQFYVYNLRLPSGGGCNIGFCGKSN